MTNKGKEMLEKMKAALSSLSVIAANYMPRALKDALLAGASKTDELERRIAALEGRDHG